jgi:hypothetical protein
MMRDDAYPLMALLVVGAMMVVLGWTGRHPPGASLAALVMFRFMRRIGYSMIALGVVVLFRRVRREGFITKGSTVVDASLNLYDLDARYGVVVPLDAAYSTIGGFMLDRLGPKRDVGGSIDANGYRFTILKMDREFISRVKIQNLSSLRN